MEKYRAAYDMGMWVQEVQGEAVEADPDRREDFAKRMTNVAEPWLQQSFDRALRSALRFVIRDLNERLYMFMEAAFKGAEGPSFRQSLPSKKEMLDLWQTIIQDHIDPRYVRDGRGGDRKGGGAPDSSLARPFAARVGALMTVWNFIADFFKKNGYDAGCLSMLGESERFKAVTAQAGVPPDNLIKKFFRMRKPCFEKGEKMTRDRQPQSFAMAQAAIDLGLSGHNFKQLRGFYSDGRKALMEEE
jgi:hypothetical protein